MKLSKVQSSDAGLDAFIGSKGDLRQSPVARRFKGSSMVIHYRGIQTEAIEVHQTTFWCVSL